jgi:4-amino-4-deoxy-L-arabinose transferase-like glycosyltransferase
MFFKLFGVTFVATRICLFLTSLGIALLMYFLSRRVCRRYEVLPCILLFSVMFGALWPTITHHADSTLFALLAVTCIVFWQDSHRNSLLLAAGVLAGATTCFLQPKGILLLLAFLAWLWIQQRRGSARLSALGWVIGGYFIIAGLVLAYFWSRGSLGDLIFANVVWPFSHYGPTNTVPYGKYLFQYYWNNWSIPTGGFRWTVGMAAVLIIPFLVVAALPALLLILGVRNRTDSMRPEILLYWICGCALWLSEFHRKDIFHLVYAAPLLIILCIHFLGESRGKIAGLALQTLSISAACLATFNLFVVLTTHSIVTRVGSVAVFRDDPVLTFLDKHVAPGEEIFAYPYCPRYYFLTATTNPTPYSSMMSNFNTPSQYQEVIRVLDQHKVRYVVWDTITETKVAGAIYSASMRMRPEDYIVEPYLESHYKAVWAENGVRIMERKSEGHAD